jgi:MoaD family protein
MRVKVKGYLTLRGVVGDLPYREFDGPELTIRDLVQSLSSELGDDFSSSFFDAGTGGVSRFSAILVNGRHYSHLPDGLDTRLAEGDEVALFPPLAGG